MNAIAKSICLAASIITLAASAHAQGRLIPDPDVHWPRPVPATFALEHHHVETMIDNQVATTTVAQVFKNNTNRALEGTYIFPIPETSSITEFSMWMNGQKVSGELVDAAKARKIYQDIVRTMRDPGLLEYIGRDLFRARVFPIPGGGEVEIEVVYHELLTLESGTVQYRYPLLTKQVAGVAAGDFSIHVQIDSPSPVKGLYSPTYDIERKIEARRASCSYEEANFRPQSDFVLYYSLSDDDIGLTLLSYRKGRGDGHFMVLLSPGRLEGPERVISKDVIFVIDRSGSMKGEKIEQARGALRYCLQSLNDNDRFNIVTFATGVTRYEDDLVPVSRRTIEDAVDFVDDIDARGGTDISGALEKALRVPASKHPQFLIFITDGAPTVGQTRADIILKEVQDQNRDRLRLFVFGVGYDVNALLLDRLAMDNRGTVDYVTPQEDIEVRVSNFYAKISEPVLSDISVRFDRVDVFDVFPRDLPDLFNGEQLTIFGRYEGSGSATVHLTGYVEDEKREFTYKASFDGRNRENDFVAPIWASRKIAFLLDEIRTNRESKELVDEIVELATDYGIVTPYTSYLILEDDRDDMPVGLRQQLESPRGGRSQWHSPRTEVGRDAVAYSMEMKKAREEEVLSPPETGGVRRVEGKTFYRTPDGWIDADFTEGMVAIEIKFLSDRYFDLIDDEPELAKFFALGESITVVYDGKAYRVTV